MRGNTKESERELGWEGGGKRSDMRKKKLETSAGDCGTVLVAATAGTVTLAHPARQTHDPFDAASEKQTPRAANPAG